MKMQKGMMVFLALILLVGLAVIGCGKSGTTTPPQTTIPAQTTTPTQTAAPPKTTTPAQTTAPPQTTAPEANKYGGILKLVPVSPPVAPIGYPPEADSGALTLAASVLEPLVKVRGDIIPWLATSWDISGDYTSITMKLRQGVKFHDGSDFNAEVAKWNLDNMTVAKRLPQFKSVDVIDNYTIRINLLSWDNSVLTSMDFNSEMISKASFDKNGIEWARWHPVGTGPFKFVEYKRDVKLVYEKNNSYWQQGKPYVNGIEWIIIADETVRKMVFWGGDAHVLRAAGTIAQELNKLGFLYKTRAGGSLILVPDSANPNSPLAKKTVRQAISYAIDRDTIANSLAFGGAVAASQIYQGFPVSKIPGLKDEYNPDKAKQLLAEAGYAKGFATTIHVFIMTPRDYVNAISSMLGKVGITVKIDVPEPGRYAQLRFNGWDDGILAHSLSSGPNLNEWIKLYLGGIQFPSLKRSEGFMDALQASAQAKTLDPVKMQALIKLIHDDQMVIAYGEEVAWTFLQKGVHDTNIFEWSLDTFSPELVWLDPELR